MTQTGYRIGFLNPWRDKAENQAFRSLEEGAARVGHTLVHCTTSNEILAANLDFVIAVASTQPKLTDVPTFGAIHEPRARFWEKPEYFENLLTYDGYMTIADSLRTFLKAFCAGAGKPQHVGFYYNTPQRQELAADIEALAARGELGLCYFGTNWDPRSRPLFRALVRSPYMRVYGPQDSWSYLQGERYCGSPAFDGNSVQKEYARHGVGLALLSRGHALDDVISNRIFEIASVGAAAICPDIPWIRKYFGDNVYYFDPNATVYEIYGQVDAAMKAIAADPAAAAAKARAARKVFEDTFASEVMIANAVQYFEEWKQRGGRRAPPSESPLIDVVVRVGGRPVDVVMRAIRSLEAQTAGRFRVVFICYKAMDLSAITGQSWERIESFVEADCLGGDRPTTMTEGMRNVTSPYFAFLDDDDFVLPSHFEGLIRQIPDASPGKLFAYSSYLHVEEGTDAANGDERETRRIHLSLQPAKGDVWEILGAFAPNGFLASSELIRFIDLDGWEMRTAEDTLMIATLAAHGEPRFTYRASACHVVGSEGASNFNDTHTRDEDVFEVFLRMQGLFDRLERNFGTPSMTNWERLGWKLQQVMKSKSRRQIGRVIRLVLEEGVLATSIHERDDLEKRPVPLNPMTMQSIGESRMHPMQGGGYEMSVLPEPSSWAFGAVMDLDRGLMFPGRQWIVAEFEEVHEGFGIGVLDSEAADFQTRNEVPASGVAVEMWLHIHDPADVSRLVIQNWTEPLKSPARLKRLWLVRESTSQVDAA